MSTVPRREIPITGTLSDAGIMIPPFGLLKKMKNMDLISQSNMHIYFIQLRIVFTEFTPVHSKT